MESEDYNQFLNIPAGDENTISSVIERVNKLYKSNFTLERMEDRSGVNFAIVRKGDANQDTIFMLGYYFGAKVHELRTKGEIEW